MNFWDRVDTLLENKGMSRKELAAEAVFDVSGIGKGKSKKLNSSPSVDIAVRIARVLGTTVEYLVTGEIPSSQPQNLNLDSFYKYERTIRNLSVIPEKQQKDIENLIEDISASYSVDVSEHN